MTKRKHRKTEEEEPTEAEIEAEARGRRKGIRDCLLAVGVIACLVSIAWGEGQ